MVSIEKFVNIFPSFSQMEDINSMDIFAERLRRSEEMAFKFDG
jgi:hypothetical protein